VTAARSTGRACALSLKDRENKSELCSAVWSALQINHRDILTLRRTSWLDSSGCGAANTHRTDASAPRALPAPGGDALPIGVALTREQRRTSVRVTSSSIPDFSANASDYRLSLTASSERRNVILPRYIAIGGGDDYFRCRWPSVRSESPMPRLPADKEDGRCRLRRISEGCADSHPAKRAMTTSPCSSNTTIRCGSSVLHLRHHSVNWSQHKERRDHLNAITPTSNRRTETGGHL
jgi:hypothetical protein